MFFRARNKDARITSLRLPFFICSKAFAILGLAALVSSCRSQDSTSGPHLSAQLIVDQTSISPGSTFTLGVKFNLEPGWHIYWKNPGDSGLPPRFKWKTSKGISISDPLWPYPERLTTGPLVNYGYSDALIPFPARANQDQKTGTATISLALEWLVCKDECLPGEGTVEIALPISANPSLPSKHAKEFEQAYSRIPVPLERMSIAIEEQQEDIILALIPLDQMSLPSRVTFFPEDRRILSNSATQVATRDGQALRLTLPRDPAHRESVNRLRGVLVSPQGWSPSGEPKAISIDTNPSAPVPADILPPAISSSLADSSEISFAGFSIALICAVLGGLLLNIMPCVFPILSIKILSFLEHAGQDRRVARQHGVAFSLGVVVSFWIVALSLFLLQAGGEQLGWGFQLQSPIFVVIMMITFFVLGLLLISDISVGHKLQQLAGRVRISTSLLGSFLSGVLATAVATPCTAPYMSTALAATLTMPAALSFFVFTALGLGMSAPYLVLSFYPGLLRFLPKPGAWMEAFKQLLAFPLFASVIWLTRVFMRQMGLEPPALDVVSGALWGLLGVALSFWIFFKIAKFYQRRASLLQIFAAALFVYSVYEAIPSSSVIEETRSRECTPNGVTTPFTDEYGLLWESYSEDRLAKILAQGRPVYLDFTAEWCITCKVNERIVFGSEEVRSLLSSKNVTLMRADWTSKNPIITNALRRFGRNGVPLNVILSSPAGAPVILPNILSPGLVRAELDKLPSPPQ